MSRPPDAPLAARSEMPDVPDAAPSDIEAADVDGTAKRSLWPVYRVLLQAALAAALIAAWEFLPKIDWLSERYKFLNSFFISSPSDVADWIWRLTTQSGGTTISLWPYLRSTVWATVVGVVIGLVLGAVAGLVVSNWPKFAQVVRPFLIVANSVPRIAIIPVFVVIVGPSVKASILSVVTVVFFLGFFNAFEGGVSVPQSMIDNAKLLGASHYDVMRRIRLPRVLSWTFAALPNAISFGLVVTVATELIAGVRGMGQLLQQGMMNINSGLTFAVIVLLAAVGLVMYGVGVALRNYLLRWESGR